MQFYLKPESGAETLFSVWDECGRLAYEVAGEFNSFGCRCVLRTPEGESAARMTGVCLPASLHCSASAGGRRMRISIDLSASRRQVQVRGVGWRFRGSALTRSFDLVEERARKPRAPQVVMTHGRCWNDRGDCYALEIFHEADVPLAVCAAVAVDSTVLGGRAAPVPAG